MFQRLFAIAGRYVEGVCHQIKSGSVKPTSKKDAVWTFASTIRTLFLSNTQSRLILSWPPPRAAILPCPFVSSQVTSVHLRNVSLPTSEKEPCAQHGLIGGMIWSQKHVKNIQKLDVISFVESQILALVLNQWNHRTLVVQAKQLITNRHGIYMSVIANQNQQSDIILSFTDW